MNSTIKKALPTLLGLILAASAGSVHAAPPAPYARPEMLVDTAWAEAHRRDPGVRIVDMRDEQAYLAGHIPESVHIAEGPLRNPEERLTYLPTPDVFAAMMSRAGVGNRTHVVIYDDEGGKMAARLWYVLNAFGHIRVSLIDGGWRKWSAEGRPAATEIPDVARTQFSPTEKPDMTCPLPEFLARRKNVVVLDTRAPDEYAGVRISPGARKAGRVPGAVNVEWKENVEGPSLTFKPAARLKAMYAMKGITPAREIVVHCAGGGRAAQTLFTLKLLGYPHVKVYYGSFGDYSALPDVPIEK